MKKVILLAFIGVVFASCASTFYTPRKDAVVEDDKYSDTIKILGVEEKFPPMMNLNYHFIRTWIDRDSQSITHQIYINRQYGDFNWHFYNRASVEGGQSLPFTEISSDVKSCSYGSCEHQEVFGLDVDQDFLEKKKEGFSIKVFGKSGDDFIIDISEDQITQQLSKVDQVLKGM